MNARVSFGIGLRGLALIIGLALGTEAMAQATTTATPKPFTAGNLVIYRVGTGTGSLVSSGNPVILDEYDPNNPSVPVQSIVIDPNDPNAPFVATGTSTAEGLLTRSTDGR